MRLLKSSRWNFLKIKVVFLLRIIKKNYSKAFDYNRDLFEQNVYYKILKFKKINIPIKILLSSTFKNFTKDKKV